MRNFIKAIVATIALTAIFSFTFSNDKLLGRWKSENDGEPTYYTFDRDGYVTIDKKGISTGGRSATSNGVQAKTTYTVNYDAKPIELDIITTDIATGKELSRMKGIIEFISDTEMRMVIGTASRPTEFIDSDAYVFTLVR
jgi:uncharacterized protein (TIGR03067 family)